VNLAWYFLFARQVYILFLRTSRLDQNILCVSHGSLFGCRSGLAKAHQDSFQLIVKFINRVYVNLGQRQNNAEKVHAPIIWRLKAIGKCGVDLMLNF